jgi:hypothetical protein
MCKIERIVLCRRRRHAPHASSKPLHGLAPSTMNYIWMNASYCCNCKGVCRAMRPHLRGNLRQDWADI